MLNKERTELLTWKRVLLLIALVFSFNTLFAQKALKILKDDGSVTYINASAVNTITFVTPLAIGDTYKGGIIFYLDASGEHGLVAAPSDQNSGNKVQWSNSNSTTGATGNGVGAGEENTYMIVGNLGSGSYAAQICRDLIIGVYTDWYLPSKYELNLMYTNLKKNGFGSFASDWYWSSTENDNVSAWRRSFLDGTRVGQSKNDYYYVRAVRAF